MRRGLALTLVLILAVTSLMMVESAFAQSIPKPSVPEFTLNYLVDSVEFTIENQPFTPYKDATGNYIHLSYYIRFKDHNSNEWAYYLDHYYYGYLNSSNSDYTVITVPFGINGIDITPVSQSEDQVLDFQVKAFIGYDAAILHAALGGAGYTYEFTGESSGWSNTQTITIGDEASTSYTPNPTSPTTSTPNPTTTSTQNLTPTPTVPEFSSLTISLILCIMLASAGLLVYNRKHK